MIKKITAKNKISFLSPAAFAIGILTAIAVILSCPACRQTAPEAISPPKVKTLAGVNGEFGEPFGLALKNDVLYLSDGELGKIWRVKEDGNAEIVTDKLNTPSAIAFDKNGDLIVADAGTHTIKKVKIVDGETETIAGIEGNKGFADGDAKNALFNAPVGVAVFEDKIFVADTYNDKIRVVENGRVSTLAGSSRGFTDDLGTRAQFDTPCGIAVMPDGSLLVADTGNQRIRRIGQDGTVTTFAGSGAANSADGFLLEAGFVEPTALTIDKFGVIYVADGNAIRAIGRRFFPFVETISAAKRGFADGVPQNAKYNRPSGIITDEKGNLFIADAENRVVRVISRAESGREMTDAEIKNLRRSPEEFRLLSAPRWTFNPPDARRDIAGTLGELRGEISDKNTPVWFHNGLDIAGAYGETARFIRAEKVLRPLAVQNFNTKRELVRMPSLGYIHLRLGRDKDDKLFDDERFQFDPDAKGQLKNVRIPRGAKFEAGEAIGTLNSMNHVHLIAGGSGAEMNALDALIFPNIADTIAPTIENAALFDENWNEIKSENPKERIKLNGKTRVVVRAFDKMDGNAANRKLGVYRLGYQILRADETPLSEINWTISFDRMPDEDAVKLVYAKGSQSGYTPQTIFNYIVTNRIEGDDAHEDFIDAATFENGNYLLRVFAADFFGNQTSQDINFTIENG